MIWSVLAGGTAVFYALHGAWSVRVSRRVGAVPAGWALFAFALPFLGANLWVRGIPLVDPGFWGLWVVNGLFNLTAWALFFSALRTGDLGIIYPLLALTPLFVLPVEWLLTGDLPAPGGAVGIGLIVGGVYLLNFRWGQRGVLAPIRALMADAGALKGIGVALIWSVSGTLDRILVARSSSAFYAFMLAVVLTVFFVPLLVWTARAGRTRIPDDTGRALPEDAAASGDSASGEHAGLRGAMARAGFPALLLHGLLFAGMVILQMEALTMALASYVLSIKRAGAILAVLIGYFAYRERALKARLAGTAVTLAGTAVLVFWG